MRVNILFLILFTLLVISCIPEKHLRLIKQVVFVTSGLYIYFIKHYNLFMTLTFIMFLLILTIFNIYFIPENKKIIIRQITLGVSNLVFISSIFLMDLFSFNKVSFLYNTFIIQIINLNTSNASLTFSTDGLSVFFFILSTFLIFLCVVFIWDKSILFKESMLILLILDLFLILIFTSLDLFFFIQC
jgi:NADH:ubiquinone oxidoreductase subunit 4 (subunit M)